MRYIVHDKTIPCKAESGERPYEEDFYNLRILILSPGDSRKDADKWGAEPVVSIYLDGEQPISGDNDCPAEHDRAEITVRLDQLLAVLVASYPTVISAWGDAMLETLRPAQRE